VKKESVCDNLHNRYKDGHLLHEKITDTRQLTGGELFKVHQIAFYEEVLPLREAKEQEKVDESDQKNAIEEFKKKQANEFDHVINSPKTEEKHVRAGVKAIVHRKKWKGNNSAVPSLVSKLRDHHEETKGCSDLSLKQYLADQDYEGNDVNCVISEVTNEIMGIVEDGAVTL
jgi:hypothetical protein